MSKESLAKTKNGTAVAILSVNHDAGYAAVRAIKGGYVTDVLLDDLESIPGEFTPQGEHMITCPHCSKSFCNVVANSKLTINKAKGGYNARKLRQDQSDHGEDYSEG
jgi:hypothetical protein